MEIPNIAPNNVSLKKPYSKQETTSHTNFTFSLQVHIIKIKFLIPRSGYFIRYAPFDIIRLRKVYTAMQICIRYVGPTF